MKSANLVLHVAGAVCALASFDPNDKFAAVKVQARAAEELRQAHARGVPAPDLRLVLEEREGDAGGVRSELFTELHPVTLQPVGVACQSVADIFAGKGAKLAPAEERSA